MLRLDFTNMMDTAVAGAISAEDWTAAHDTFRRAHVGVNDDYEAGRLGFIDLPTNRACIEQTEAFVARAAERFREVVVLGIGGSALGPIALRTALRPPGWNGLTDGERGGLPQLHVLDNVDPSTIDALLGHADLRRTLFVVTSKSGGTAETMAQYLIVRERLERVLGREAVKDHLVFITDPEKGALRAIARAEGIPALDVPPNVGGRFSVLSPVGLLPAALIGIDVRALLAGARDMAQRSASAVLAENPAGCYAALQWLAHTRHDKVMHVLMPYADSLRDFAAWFVQLWAESLGKVRPDGVSVGPTPIAALGATDQHSQVQLFMEGPADKTVTFVAVEDRGDDVVIPGADANVLELAYLGGHTLGELIDIERRATAGALARRGRPNMTIALARVDPWHVGALIMFLELATAYAGQLYGVNAFDPPGVERGKQFAYAMLGRPDAAAARTEWDALPKSESRWQV
jgi:glucose-6-phosphate isomerase